MVRLRGAQRQGPFIMSAIVRNGSAVNWALSQNQELGRGATPPALSPPALRGRELERGACSDTAQGNRKLPRLFTLADCFFPGNIVSILPVVAIACRSGKRRGRKQDWMHHTAYRERTTRMETMPGENRVSSGIVVFKHPPGPDSAFPASADSASKREKGSQAANRRVSIDGRQRNCLHPESRV